MNSNSKRFFNETAARRTFLRCSIGGYFPIPSPSVFSFGFEYCGEHSPSCVRYAFGKAPVLNHVFDIKSFYSKTIIGVHERMSSLVAKIKPLICNLFMVSCNQQTSFYSAVGSFLSTTKSSLSIDKRFFCISKILRRFYLMTITGGDKGIKTNINPYLSSSFVEGDNLTFRGKANIPFIIPSSNGKRLNLANDRSMPFYFNTTYILKIKLIFFNLATISKSSIGNSIKSISRFKTRIPRLFSIFNSAEECLKRLIQSSQCLLQRAIIADSKAFIFLLECRKKPSCLHGIRNPIASCFISFFSLSKGFIIKETMSINLGNKCLCLLVGRVKSIFKRLEHLFAFFRLIPIRRFAFWANTNLFLFGCPLVSTSFAIKFYNFNLHTLKYILKVIVRQVKNTVEGGYAISLTAKAISPIV